MFGGVWRGTVIGASLPAIEESETGVKKQQIPVTAKAQRVPREQLIGLTTQSQKSRVVLCPNVEGGRLIRDRGLLASEARHLAPTCRSVPPEILETARRQPKHSINSYITTTWPVSSSSHVAEEPCVSLRAVLRWTIADTCSPWWKQNQRPRYPRPECPCYTGNCQCRQVVVRTFRSRQDDGGRHR